MSLILRQSLALNSAQKRVMGEQWKELQALRSNSLADMQQFLELTGNAARTPAEAYREFDATTKIDQVPAGEYATLTRLLQKARPINIGKEVFEYRKSTTAGIGQTSLSGQIGVKADHVDYKYAGTVVPIHDIATSRRYREVESMRAEGFDAMVDDNREAERSLMGVMDSYMWDGDSSIELKGNVWLGIKNDPTVASATIGVDLASSSTTATEIRNEVARIRDILYITNNCTNGLRLGVSREIMSNWEQPFATTDAMFGTILEFVGKLRGIVEIYEDSRLVGNQLVMYWDDQQGFHPVVGMGMSTYMVPRQFHNSDFTAIKWAAVGFLAKTDAENRKCALYAEQGVA